jgi:hypothetical protein
MKGKSLSKFGFSPSNNTDLYVSIIVMKGLYESSFWASTDMEFISKNIPEAKNSIIIV